MLYRVEMGAMGPSSEYVSPTLLPEGLIFLPDFLNHIFSTSLEE